MERWRGALRELADAAADVIWRYGAFELDPAVPREGIDSRVYMEARHGTADLGAAHQRLAAMAAEEGLPFDYAAAKMRPNTFDAHRLMAAAWEVGPAIQQALGDGLFRAHWAAGKDVGDTGVLLDVAEAAGLERGRASQVLETGACAAAVREEERRARESGIRAVPTFVLDGRLAVSGAQPSADLARVARHALATATG